ncbi:MAG: hypothetical protein JJD93_11285 [Ilumatobacteraceae bacterium]|nr:hypothetical protein [Ilumatobacteraceae bacterium]
MADLDRVAVRVSDGLRKTLSRISSLALGIAAIAAVIGVATFFTGLWIFTGSRPAWIVIGGAVCLAPPAAALLAWFYVRVTLRVAPALLSNVRTLLEGSQKAANVLINYDTGERLASTAKSFGDLQLDLKERRKEFPALYLGIRAICSVPGLAAIAFLGTLAVGALGTILLIAGLLK